MTKPMTLDQARARFKELTGKPPHGKRGAPSIIAEIEVLEEKQAAREAEREAEQAKRAAEQSARDARAAARGSLRAAADLRGAERDQLDDDEQFLAFVAKRMQGRLDGFSETIEAFVESLRSDPAHALKWSSGIFTLTAEHQIAEQFRHAFEEGASLDQLRDMALRNTIRAARYPASSTSAQSNELEGAIGAAWADLSERLAAI
ncbi:MAG: hypothetical protein LC676_10800 [Loktanella sp.]|nr:hypothetical protein [Loktanella sp.]